MALSSTMRSLGSELPDFELPDTVGGRVVASRSLRGQPALVVAFICNHCPYVVHILEGLAAFGRDCRDKGVPFVAISSNDIGTHPQDGPERMAELAQANGFVFPYLYDESQEVARAFDAACTPDFFAFDASARLAYRGQFDASRPGNDQPVTGADLRAAVEAMLRGEAPGVDQTPSIGCGIKWRK